MSGKCTTSFFDYNNFQYFLSCHAALQRSSTDPVTRVTLEKTPIPTSPSPQQTAFYPFLIWPQFQCLLKCVEKKTGDDIHQRCYRACLEKPYNPNPGKRLLHPEAGEDLTVDYDDDPATPSGTH
jgi:hypothetical protein